MDRMLKQFWNDEYRETALGEWAPMLDILETPEALVVKAEIPGIDPKEIQIQLREQLLILKGEKRFEKDLKDAQYHRVERAHGVFLRTVELPVAVDEQKVVATFKNGLLTITMPKVPGKLGMTIPIRTD
jgi:HSP20 family protein